MGVAWAVWLAPHGLGVGMKDSGKVGWAALAGVYWGAGILWPYGTGTLPTCRQARWHQVAC